MTTTTVDISSDHRQESVFAIFQLISIYHWAKISDVVGRRPVVLLGSVGMGLTTLLFGFSHNLTHMLITRSLNGFFAGQYLTCPGSSILLINAVIVDRKHRGRSQCPWRTFRSDEPGHHLAALCALLAARRRHRSYAWRNV